MKSGARLSSAQEVTPGNLMLATSKMCHWSQKCASKWPLLLFSAGISRSSGHFAAGMHMV